MPISTKKAKSSRSFATRKYPVFGAGVFNEKNPPKTVISSPFYWWFKFLQLNDEYSRAVRKQRTKVSKQVVEDFGRVDKTDFKSWWKTHSHLFTEPETDYSLIIARKNEELAPFDSKDVINLVVPLHWTNVGIKRRVSQLIDKLVPKTPKGQPLRPSDAPYRLGRKWSIIAFEAAYNIYMLKKQSDLGVSQGKKKIPWADIALMANLPIAVRMNQGKHSYDKIAIRNALTAIAIRHFDRAEDFIKAAATSEFPSKIN
jgi:hypothetical protein